MTDEERAMELAIEQIVQLRRHNEVLAAKVDTMNLMAAFLFARPQELGGMAVGEDAVWLLRRELSRIREEEERNAAALATKPTTQGRT